MYYRFVIGSGQEKSSALIGFTVHADNQAHAIQKAQVVVDSLQLISDSTDFDESRTCSSPNIPEPVEAFDFNVYTGDGYRVTSDDLEDWWKDEDN